MMSSAQSSLGLNELFNDFRDSIQSQNVLFEDFTIYNIRNYKVVSMAHVLFWLLPQQIKLQIDFISQFFTTVKWMI
jgi:hypothetical protein